MPGVADVPMADDRYRGMPGIAQTMSYSRQDEQDAPSAGPSSLADSTGSGSHATVAGNEGVHTNGTTTPKRPIKLKPLRKILDNALNQLQRRDLYLFFAQPVKASDVPDYFQHIKQPMDLGTMQKKLEAGHYKTLDQFRQDFLLVTRNAQYYNTLEGPSAIVHTEAKKLEDWGLKFLAREEPAVEETAPKRETLKTASPGPGQATDALTPAKKAGRISIKLKKQPAMSTQTSASATPRTATPSRLQHEIKLEAREEDDGPARAAASSAKAAAIRRKDDIVDDGKDEGDGRDARSASSKRRKAQTEASDGDDSENEDAEEESGDEDSGSDEEDEDEDEDEDDDEDDDSDADSSRGGVSMSPDDLSTPDLRATPGAEAPRRRRRWKRAANKKKQQVRQSAVVALLTRPAKDKEGKSELAHISSASDMIAANIPREYSADGTVDLSKLLEDEKIALLRAAGVDTSSDVLIPFIDSLTPVHPDLLPNLTSYLRELRDVADGFGAVLAEESQEQDTTQTYDIPDDKPQDQRRYPFGLSSGWIFRQKAADVPLAWPRPVPTPGLNQPSEPQPQHGGGPLRRKDRDGQREKEEIGLTNLDDWTYPRPHQSRLIETRDLGLYPGLLPAAWVNHIAYQKGGPAQSRLPPLYLAIGSAFENAVLDELASLPNRVLLSGKPGALSTTTALPAPSPLDVATAIELASDRDWDLSGEEAKKAGVRGGDVIREAVYGGALGEAYAASVDEFVRGAALSAEETFEAEQVALAEMKSNEGVHSENSGPPQATEQDSSGPQSYFDENGEMYNVDSYIGVDLIPLEVRKEAGMVAQTGVGSNVPTERATPIPAQTPPVEEPISYKRMRTTSRYMPNKRRLTETLEMSLRSETASAAPETPMEIDAHDDGAPVENTTSKEDEARKAEEEEEEERAKQAAFQFPLDDQVSAFLRGSILERSLLDHVKLALIDPLTGGLLQLLDLIWEGISSSASDGQANAKFNVAPEILHEVAELISSSTVKSEDGTALDLEADATPRLPLVPPPDFKVQLVGLVRRLYRREYYKSKSQLLELSRAQNSSIQLDGLVRGKDDLTRSDVEKADPSHAAALLFENIGAPFDSQRTRTILSQAAEEIVALSDALTTGTSEGSNKATDQERLDKLRAAYITLAHHVPQRDMRKGHWSARLEAMRKDEMRAYQAGHRGGNRPAHVSSRPSFGQNGGFPPASPSTPGQPSAVSPLDKISSVNNARLDISKLGAHPSLLASLAAMSSKKSPQPQSQPQTPPQSTPSAAVSPIQSGLPTAHPLLPGGQGAQGNANGVSLEEPKETQDGVEGLEAHAVVKDEGSNDEPKNSEAGFAMSATLDEA